MGRPIFIAGPTASGKSAVAMEVARHLGGAIVSVDSMQVYRGMDLGTAKPSAEEQAAIRHHLIDTTELTESYDAATFISQAQEAAAAEEQAIFCGGTGLYFQALLEGLGEAPRAKAKIRAELENTATEKLIEELAEKDPTTHGAIDHQNRRRLVRAVEVIRITGKPFSEQRAEWTGQVPEQFYLLQREAEDLRTRIEERVEQMFAKGLVDETRALLPALEQNRTASQALGYRQVLDHLRGERDLPDTIALVKSRTWQFARRQQTWFRKLKGATHLQVAAGEDPAATAQRILDSLP